jgi:hypothetical protein
MAAKSRRKKKKKDEKDSITQTKLNRHWQNAENGRKEVDWRWFVYDLWVNGDHYARWDRNTQQIVVPPTDKGKPKIVINKIFTTLRTVRNFTLKNKPKAEVTPFDLTEETLDRTLKLNKFLDYLSEKLGLRRLLQGAVWQALKYSVGFWQVLWNEDDEDGTGEIDIRLVDAYDLYWEPSATEPKNAKYVILATRRNIQDLKNDDKYDKEKVEQIQTDKRLAASSLKERLLQADRGTMFGGSDKEDTTIVQEHWWIEKDKEGKDKVMIAAIAGGIMIREPEVTGTKIIPFFRLPSDVDPMRMYSQGWVKNLIPVNKMIDRLESQLAEYNDIMNKGKWISDKGAGVRVINNESGQIIEKKRGYEVRQGAISPLSAAVYQQIQNANQYMEDIGGARDAITGNLPSGIMSGRALEALQIGAANSLAELIENTEIFLEEVFEYVLSLASQKYQVARNVIAVSQSGEKEFMEVIGEEAEDVEERAEGEENLVVIPKKSYVDVRITSWLAHTPEIRRETLKELYTLQAIDQETLLEGYNIGNVSDIIDKTRKQRAQAAAEGVAVEEARGAEGEETPAGAGQEQAIADIRLILNGQAPEPRQDVSPEYIQYIDEFLATQELPEEIKSAVQTYRDGVVRLQGGGA